MKLHLNTGQMLFPTITGASPVFYELSGFHYKSLLGSHHNAWSKESDEATLNTLRTDERFGGLRTKLKSSTQTKSCCDPAFEEILSEEYRQRQRWLR